MAPSGAPGLWLLILPLLPIDYILATDNNTLFTDIGPGTGCVYEGVRYKTGQAVPVKDEPCLRCRCRRGAPVCRLRVCAPLPDPPPRGCVLLHRANTCCPELHCPESRGPGTALRGQPMNPIRYRADTPSRGCYLNGSLFAEGSALSSSSLCDYCYCVRGQQRCVRPQCVLPAPGCTPEYREHACCPTSYHCGPRDAASPTTAAPSRARSGCVVDGRRYREGAQVKSLARGRCETCFCMRGQVRCAPLKCDLPLDGCHPVTVPGKCCPESYDCSKSRVSITKTVSSSSSTSGTALRSKVTSSRPSSIWENSVRSFDARSHREISSRNSSKSLTATERAERLSPTTIMDIITTDDNPTTTMLADSSHDMSVTLNTKFDLSESEDQAASKIKTRTIAPEKNKILPVIEAIINKTRQKDQDYDYDYNEPSLPPSLPNLRIIPFVAADAVVMEDKSSPGSDQDFPKISHGVSLQQPQDKIESIFDFFSPPAETEGGFVPRNPVEEGPFFQANDKPQAPLAAEKISTKPDKFEVTVRTVIPEAVTPDPLLGNTGSEPCTSAGRRYRHGELLSGMGACRMCFCFDGGIVCQEPSCGSVPPGCRRAPPRDADQCCGSIVCADGDREAPILFTDLHQSLPQRVNSKTPEKTTERIPTVAPVPDLVHILTKPAATSFGPRHPSTTTTPKETTPTSTATPEPVQATTARHSTTTERKHTSTRVPTPPSRPSTSYSTVPPVRSTSKPATRPKTTTSKPWVLKRTTPASTTPKVSSTQLMKNSTTPTTMTTTTTTTTTKTPPTQTTKRVSTTTAATSTMSTTKMTTTTTTTTTERPSANKASTYDAAIITVSTPKTSSPTLPSTTVRSTTAASSFFAGLWGDDDESTNEAQDKVDTDVEYHDFVSTNQHEQGNKPPAEDDDDSFSFDKLLELFINPDPPTTVLPILSSTPLTTKATPTTSRVDTSTTRAPPKENKPQISSAPPRPASTSQPSAILKTTGVNTGKPVNASTPSISAEPVPTTSTAKPPVTTQRPAITTKKAVVTTSSPKPSTMKVTPMLTTTPASKLTSKPKVTSTRPPITHFMTTVTSTFRPTTTTTATSTSRSTTLSTTSAAVVNTTPNARPSAVFISNKNRVPVQHSSYPAQMHHLSTRKPVPGVQGSTTTHRPSAMLSDPAGISGLLKLAGCNIYGRMYRVGRIIQELSGPCLECRCTEVGVQCQQLAC